jgi:UDP-N-acetylmuramate: L-alanyl-gamma-D-glutamyl-meso-diaminopimelate ligase
MGAVAVALFRAGYQITGSDEDAYSPMPDLLRTAGIRVAMPYSATNIPADVDLVVVGKRIRETNSELQGAIAGGLPCCSFPSLLHRLYLNRSRNAVVTGGVGKTTSAAMLAWILEFAGSRPDYLIGGRARNFEAPARFAGAEFAVVEGDEYASGFDDPRPKFMHYRPTIGVVTNILEDHPDLYSDLDSVEKVFEQFVRLLPASGCLVIPDDDEAAARVASHAKCPSLRVGFSEDANIRITDARYPPGHSCFELEQVTFDLPQSGRMNVRNAAMAAVAALQFGVTYRQSSAALARFLGVDNRQERQRIGGYVVVSDKASHPVALRALFEAIRQDYPARRILSVIQPRATGGRNWIYQRDLPDSLARADRVLVIAAYEHNPEPDRAWTGGAFSTELLVSDLARRGRSATAVAAFGELPGILAADLRPDDVIIVTAPEQARGLLPLVEETLARFPG